MTCRKCRHEFCWICFADWRTHKACNQKSKEVQEKEASERSAKTELERYEYYIHRWESHKKSADVARRDLNNLFVLETYYVNTFGVRTQDVDFLASTLNNMISGRLMLSWAYVREFYWVDKRISAVEKNMWSHYLGELEVHVDRLQEYYEKGQHLQPVSKDFLAWKMETVNLTRVAQRYFDGFVEGVIHGDLAVVGGDKMSETERFYSAQLQTLEGMGFADKDMLVPLLEKYGGDVERVISSLIAL